MDEREIISSEKFHQEILLIESAIENKDINDFVENWNGSAEEARVASAEYLSLVDDEQFAEAVFGYFEDQIKQEKEDKGLISGLRELGHHCPATEEKTADLLLASLKRNPENCGIIQALRQKAFSAFVRLKGEDSEEDNQQFRSRISKIIDAFCEIINRGQAGAHEAIKKISFFAKIEREKKKIEGVLRSAFRGDDEDLSVQALSELAEIVEPGDEEILPALHKEAESISEMTEQSTGVDIARKLGLIGDQSSIELLENLIGHQNEVIAREAEISLDKINERNDQSK